MIVNARREVGLINPESMQYLEIDIYLPSLQLGFEYQVGGVPLMFELSSNPFLGRTSLYIIELCFSLGRRRCA